MVFQRSDLRADGLWRQATCFRSALDATAVRGEPEVVELFEADHPIFSNKRSNKI
jgi:hypothetical protein